MNITALTARLMDRPKRLSASGQHPAISGTTLTFSGSMVNIRIVTGAAQNIDKIVSTWQEGRRIHVSADSGNASNTVTLRDNQSGTNLVLKSTSVALGALDSVWLRADMDSSGNQIWVQDSEVCNIS